MRLPVGPTMTVGRDDLQCGRNEHGARHEHETLVGSGGSKHFMGTLPRGLERRKDPDVPSTGLRQLAIEQSDKVTRRVRNTVLLPARCTLTHSAAASACRQTRVRGLHRAVLVISPADRRTAADRDLGMVGIGGQYEVLVGVSVFVRTAPLRNRPSASAGIRGRQYARIASTSSGGISRALRMAQRRLTRSSPGLDERTVVVLCTGILDVVIPALARSPASSTNSAGPRNPRSASRWRRTLFHKSCLDTGGPLRPTPALARRRSPREPRSAVNTHPEAATDSSNGQCFPSCSQPCATLRARRGGCFAQRWGTRGAPVESRTTSSVGKTTSR